MMTFPVVATSPGFASTDAQRETWDVPVEVAEGTALIAGTDRVGVAYTGSGGHTGSETIGPLTISGFPDGGQSLAALRCSVATDGSWEFAVTGVDADTLNGTIVYAVVDSVTEDLPVITELTTSATTGTAPDEVDNLRFGTVNCPEGYTPSDEKVVVKVGA